MLGQPAADSRVLVSGAVVADHMQHPARIGPGDLLEKAQELLMTMARVALVGDLPGGHLQSSEQGGGAVPDVVVGVLLDPARPDPTDRLGSTAWNSRLLIHTQH